MKPKTIESFIASSIRKANKMLHQDRYYYQEMKDLIDNGKWSADSWAKPVYSTIVDNEDKTKYAAKDSRRFYTRGVKDCLALLRKEFNLHYKTKKRIPKYCKENNIQEESI